MRRTRCFICLSGLLCVICIVPVCCAGTCAYGSAYAWFKGTDGGWVNATAHPLMRRGESFEIRIVVTTSTDLCMLYIKLHEFGTPVYEVLEGPTSMEQLLECRHLPKSGQSVTYVWKMKVRQDTSWVNAYAPLEVFVQFNKNDTKIAWIQFDVITAFVIDEPSVGDAWEPIQESDSSNEPDQKAIPVFDAARVLVIVSFFAIALRLYQQRQT